MANALAVRSSSYKRRKPLANAVETEILVSCRRRCCLCFFLDGDERQKAGQIAHIDRDRTNNAAVNLAFLCLRHHDQYDSSTSQSKGITQGEILHAKGELIRHMREQFSSERIRITISIEGDFDNLSDAERSKLLSDALGAAQVTNSVRVIKVTKGSVVFFVDIATNDALALVRAFNSGQLKDVRVLAVEEGSISPKGILFASTFNNYSHGVSKRDVAKVLTSPDAQTFLSGKEQVDFADASVGIFYKRLNDNFTVLILTDANLAVNIAFPIPHKDVDASRCSNAVELLSRFVDAFGLAIRLDGVALKLRIGEFVKFPRQMSNIEMARYLEKRAQENGVRYELVCVWRPSTFHSSSRMVELLFAVDKDRYFASLVRLGLPIKRTKGGRFFGTVRK
ncbi:MAG: hypothetical protein WAS73_06515 [Defluviicoccus sp.]